MASEEVGEESQFLFNEVPHDFITMPWHELILMVVSRDRSQGQPKYLGCVPNEVALCTFNIPAFPWGWLSLRSQ